LQNPNPNIPTTNKGCLEEKIKDIKILLNLILCLGFGIYSETNTDVGTCYNLCSFSKELELNDDLQYLTSFSYSTIMTT